MGEQYLYQKFPFLSQKKELSEIYLPGLLLLYYLSNTLEVTVLTFTSFQE